MTKTEIDEREKEEGDALPPAPQPEPDDTETGFPAARKSARTSFGSDAHKAEGDDNEDKDDDESDDEDEDDDDDDEDDDDDDDDDDEDDDEKEGEKDSGEKGLSETEVSFDASKEDAVISEHLEGARSEPQPLVGKLEADEEPAQRQEPSAIDDQTKLRLLEATLFASADPLSANVLQQQFGKETDIDGLLVELQNHYSQHGVNLVEIGGLWSFRTATDLADLMKITRQTRRKLPRAAAEVLAIIAYHQPVTRGEIESIRGVETSRGTLDILLELGWIRPGKRRETPGRPLNWQTTPEFLGHFNIATLDELPGLEDLKAAGLLDTRPVLENLSAEREAADASPAEDDDDFSAWVTESRDADSKTVAAK